MIAAAVLLLACQAEPDAPPAATPPEPPAQPEPQPDLEPAPDGEPADEHVDPAAIGANELGRIPVIMYHRIVDDGSIYDTTPDDFRAELELLYEYGYRPIRAVDLVDGVIDIPAGTSPVVLTFDDSSPSQFSYLDNGQIDPDTAVGILLEVAAQYPDTDPTASFYVIAEPFGVGRVGGADKLRHLHALGFEVGNHTYSHGNLRELGPDGARRDLARGAQAIRDAVPAATVRTLALPFGVMPDDPATAHEGEHDGITYRHDGILLVGAGPSLSPFDTDFDPLAIPRIRSQPIFEEGDDPDYGSGYWISVLRQDAHLRYVSDGNPDTISFPQELHEQLNPRFADRANPY